jgi:hypothetical protein
MVSTKALEIFHDENKEKRSIRTKLLFINGEQSEPVHIQQNIANLLQTLSAARCLGAGPAMSLVANLTRRLCQLGLGRQGTRIGGVSDGAVRNARCL